MRLSVLSVAYPLAPVSPDAVGGAEQILSRIDAALVARGHRSIVVAREDSRVADTLIPVPLVAEGLETAAPAAQARHRAAILAALRRFSVDVIHLHGIDFFHYLPPMGWPALVTLHGPLSWYPKEALRPTRADTWLHCVSAAQAREVEGSPCFLDPIENGVPVDALQGARHARRGFALFLGRIAPEKGVHLAIEAAKAAGVPLLIAGEIFRYGAHERYFEEEIRPRLDAARRFIGPLDFARKRRFLSAARCLLVPSLVPETSSLVAREAAACGTPVIAFPNGALAQTIEDGRTGFLASDVAGMAAAIPRVDEISPEACRAHARARFRVEDMAARYLAVYRSLAGLSIRRGTVA